jgi:Holliday junction DNA helicase RuvB
MTAWEVVKTIFGYYRNDFKGNGWEEGPGIWMSKEKYHLDQDLREIDEINEERGLTGEEIKEIEKVERTKAEEKDIFSIIYGHDSLKLIFKNALTSNEQVHILLTGAAGSAKSLFLEAIAENIKCSYLITNNSTGAGIIQYLYDHPELKYLLIDEIEKIGKLELSVLLTLMEAGRLIVQKKTMSVNRRQNLTIFATCNNKNKLSQEILSRFLKFHLKEYSFEEFNKIAIDIVINKIKKTEEYAEKLALAVWYNMYSKDIRDLIKVARLAKTEDDIDTIIEAIQEYQEINNRTTMN